MPQPIANIRLFGNLLGADEIRKIALTDFMVGAATPLEYARLSAMADELEIQQYREDMAHARSRDS